MQTSPGVGVVVAPEPFTPRVETLEVQQGCTIAAILLEAVRAGHLDVRDLPRTEVFLDGMRFDDRAAALDIVPQAGQTLNIAVLPQGGGKGKGNKVAQTVLTIAVMVVAFVVGGPTGPLAAAGGKATLANALIRATAAAAIQIAGTAAVNALFGPGSPDAQTSGRALYGLQGQSNQARHGRQFPLRLGRRRWWFDLASSAYTETVGEDIFLHVIYGLHYGPWDLDEATLKLGETLFSTLPAGDVQYELALTPGPRNFTLYPMRVIQESYTDDLNEPAGEYITHTTAEDCEKIQLDIAMPAGLYYTNEKGAVLAYDVHFHVQYKSVDSATWLNAPLGAVSNIGGQPLSAGSIYVHTLTKDGFNITREWEVPKGQYDVRVQRVPNNQTLLGQLTASTLWVALRTVENKKPVIDENLACIAVRFKATSQINGNVPPISGEGAAICPVYSGGNWETLAPTSNPAAHLRWLLTGPAAARPLSVDEIDASCAVQFALIAERGWEAALEVVNDESQEDVMLALGRAGRFTSYWNGSKLCVIGDWEKPVPRQLFTGRNAQGYRYRRMFPEPVHAVRVSFLNSDEDSQPDELVVYNDGYVSSTAELYETLELRFSCSPSRAYREGRVYLAKKALLVESHEWTGGLDSVASTYGDRVLLRHRSSLYGAAEARVRFRRWSGALVSGVRLDEPVTLEAGKDYAIDVRRADGLLLGLSVINSGETTRTLFFATPLAAADAPEPGDLVAFGEVELITEDLELLDVSPTADGKVQYIAQAYRGEDIIAAETGPIPPLLTVITARTAAPKPRVRGARGAPEGVTVNFDVEGQRVSPVRGFSARWRFTPGEGDDSNWLALPDLPPTARTVKTPPVLDSVFDEDGEFTALLVDVEIRTVLENGDISEPGRALGIQVKREVAPVTGFQVLPVVRQAPDGSSYPAVQISADAQEAGLITELVVEQRPAGGGAWTAAGPALRAANPRGDFTDVQGGATYDFRAKWRTGDGWAGPWAYEEDVLIESDAVVAGGVRTIDGLTPAQVRATLEDASEVGRLLTLSTVELAARVIEANAQVVSETFHNGRKVKRILFADNLMWEEGSKSLWERTAGIAVLGSNGQSMILQKDTLIWDEGAGTTMAGHLNAVISQIGGDIASAVQETKTWVNASSAGAQWISQLEVQFGGNFQGAITQTYEVVSDLGATGTVVFNVNGHLSGWRHVNTGATSSFIFLTNNFAVTDGTTAIYPFAVVGGEVWATTLRVGRLFADSVETETLKVGAASAAVSHFFIYNFVLTINVPQPAAYGYITTKGGKVRASVRLGLGTGVSNNGAGFEIRLYRTRFGEGSPTLIDIASYKIGSDFTDDRTTPMLDENPGNGPCYYEATVMLTAGSGVSTLAHGRILLEELRQAA